MGEQKSWIPAAKVRKLPLFRRDAHAEREEGKSKWAVQTYQPRVAVLMTPFGLDLADRMRNCVYIADGAHNGDVLGGVW